VFDFASYKSLENTNLVIDEQNQLPKSVQMGDQIWMTKNLSVTTFSNGEPIPEARSQYEWALAFSKKEPAFCYIHHDKNSAGTYGVLYNMYALIDPRGIAPKGWHVPSVNELEKLMQFIKDTPKQEGFLKPFAGSRIMGDKSKSDFLDLNSSVSYWSSTIRDERIETINTKEGVRSIWVDKNSGFALRLVKNSLHWNRHLKHLYFAEADKLLNIKYQKKDDSLPF
jgi:uncharacterized protein (TIGR02145 family)